jgi:CRP-like cAMP-binding protein
VHALASGASSNRLLEALAREDFQLLASHLVSEKIAQGTVLFDAGAEVDQLYFPLSGMVSLVVVMRDGKTIETATVGREGAIGAMAGLGLHVSTVRAIAQLPVFASRIGAPQFRKAAGASNPIAHMCILCNEVLLEQARITAACNALHGIEARFCRWLLQTRDRAESDTIMLTQEFLSEMLGVRRTSVTEVAHKIQADGVISYSRGAIKITDLEALKVLSCECYETLREHTSQITRHK